MRIVTIKFRAAGKRYDFNAQQFDLAVGDQVVVETDRGRALGSVVLPPRELEDDEAPRQLKNVIRPATEEDLNLGQVNAAREEEAYRFCLKRIEERQMPMKLVQAEYQFDGSKIIFYFTADGRVDFRELVKDLAHHFHTRIEMRQIGVRDEAKLVGGLGICGRELCCCTFLTEFAPVSVKMAKEQGLALNPNKISGQCSRLLCCLSYEFETYCANRKGLPKCGKKVDFEGQRMHVCDVNILRREITLAAEDGERFKVTGDQFEKGRREPEQKPAAPEPTAGQKTEHAAKDRGQQDGDASRKRRRPRRRQKSPADQQQSAESGQQQKQLPAPEQKSTGDSEVQPQPKEGQRKRRPRRRRRKKNPSGGDNNPQN
ncbi:MAG: stage 0 sporulation family protein [Geothermobacteraceae bacterium]